MFKNFFKFLLSMLSEKHRRHVYRFLIMHRRIRKFHKAQKTMQIVAEHCEKGVGDYKKVPLV